MKEFTVKKETGNSAGLVVRIRAAMGLTQEQFAAQFGVTVATVNRWENGRAPAVSGDKEPEGMGEEAKTRIIGLIRYQTKGPGTQRRIQYGPQCRKLGSKAAAEKKGVWGNFFPVCRAVTPAAKLRGKREDRFHCRWHGSARCAMI